MGDVNGNRLGRDHRVRQSPRVHRVYEGERAGRRGARIQKCLGSLRDEEPPQLTQWG